MSDQMIITLVGLGISFHLIDVLEESGKETFTKDEIAKCYTEAMLNFQHHLYNYQRESMERDLAELGYHYKVIVS